MKSLIVFFLFVLAGVASAQVPRTISYQGLLTDAVSGNAIPDGNHSLTIKLYDVIVGGNHLYSETQVLPVVKGIFNFIIGSVTPLPATLLFDKQYFLGVSVDVGTELSPRSPLAAVPYAFEAGHATDADNAKESGSSKLADIAKEADHAKIADEAKNLASGATGVVKSVNNQSGVLTFQGSGGTTVTNVGNTITIGSTGGSGTGIQGVQSTDGSLAVTNPNGPVADLKIQLNSITSAYVKDGSLKAADFVRLVRSQPLSRPTVQQAVIFRAHIRTRL